MEKVVKLWSRKGVLEKKGGQRGPKRDPGKTYLRYAISKRRNRGGRDCQEIKKNALTLGFARQAPFPCSGDKGRI